MRRSVLVCVVVFAVAIGVARAGGLDTGFGSNGVAVTPLSATTADRLNAVAAAPGGGAYAAGLIDGGGDYRAVVAKITAAGGLDPAFGTGAGFASTNWAVGGIAEIARAVAVQSSGKVVVAGVAEHPGASDPRDRDVYVTRFNPDGGVDGTFGTGGTTVLDLSAGEVSGTGYAADFHWDIEVGSGDSLYLSAAQKATGRTDLQVAVVKLTANGVRDPGYGTNGVATVDVLDGVNHVNESVRGLEVLPGGEAVVAFYATIDGLVRARLAKFDAAGVLAAGFGTGGVTTADVLPQIVEFQDVEAQGSKLVTAGYGRASSGETFDVLTVRFTAAGALDTSFGGGDGFERHDFAGFNDQARKLTVLAGDRLLVSGVARLTETTVDAFALVYLPDGGLDATFDGDGALTADLGGTADTAFGAAALPGERVVLAGSRATSGDTAGEDAAWTQVYTAEATPTPTSSPGTTATPTPSVTPTGPAPKLSVATIASSSLKAKRGKVGLKLACSDGDGGCRGTARIRSAKKVKVGKKRKKIGVIKAKAYQVDAGKAKTLTLSLTRAAKRALRRGAYKVGVELTPTGAGAKVVKTLRLKG